MLEEIQLAEKRQAVFSDTLCAPVRPLPATRTDRRKKQDDEKNQRKNSEATHSANFVFLLRSPN
jgi:hypothetical protein